MTLPANVVRTASLPWSESKRCPPGFQSRSKRILQRSAHPAIGAHLEELPVGERSCPLHWHLVEEEHLYVLSGTLTVRELAADDEAYREFELHPGELVAYPAGKKLAHGSFNRGTEPAVFLALSDRRPGDVCFYPDSGKLALRALPEVGVWEGRPYGDPEPEAALDAAAHVAAASERAATRAVTRLDGDDRPDHVVWFGRVGERELAMDEWRVFGMRLSRSAGAVAVGVNRDRVEPGCRTSPLHWHARNEELVMVLEGRPTLRQWRGRRGEYGRPSFQEPEEERIVLEPGDVVHWPADEPLAHQIVNESDDDAVLLVAGDEQPDDVCVMPERGDIWAAALEQVGVLQPCSYWEGEG